MLPHHLTSHLPTIFYTLAPRVPRRRHALLGLFLATRLGLLSVGRVADSRRSTSSKRSSSAAMTATTPKPAKHTANGSAGAHASSASPARSNRNRSPRSSPG